MNPSPPSAYWRANLRLIAVLLLAWFLAAIVGSILVVEFLNGFKLGRLPFGFWLAQQGSIYLFVALIFAYAVRMEAIDRRYRRSPSTPVAPERDRGGDDA